MVRILAGAFVATTTAGCGAEPPPNPPRPRPTVQTPTPGTATAPVPQPTPTPTVQQPKPAMGPVNPKDAQGRTIHLDYDGEGCFVELPYPPLKPGEQRFPGTPPPRQDAPCPPEMGDPAYASCRGGVVRTTASGSCECFLMANPPRVSPNACPGT